MTLKDNLDICSINLIPYKELSLEEIYKVLDKSILCKLGLCIENTPYIVPMYFHYTTERPIKKAGAFLFWKSPNHFFSRNPLQLFTQVDHIGELHAVFDNGVVIMLGKKVFDPVGYGKPASLIKRQGRGAVAGAHL